jgi:hypothetical protein
MCIKINPKTIKAWQQQSSLLGKNPLGVLSTMFNWLKRKQKSDTDDDRLASITYYVDLDNTIKLDISMQDYDKASVEAITSLLEILSKDAILIETLNFFQNSMHKHGRDDITTMVLIKLGTVISKNKEYNDGLEQPPYIKPSELSKG